MAKGTGRGHLVISTLGKKFGKLTPNQRVPKPEGETQSGAYWLCDCDCGGTKITCGARLRLGLVSSCGCIERGKLSVVAPKQRFGRLVVRCIGSRPSHSKSVTPQGRYWCCDCDCGENTVVRAKDLMSGNTISCGCRKRQMAARIRRNGESGGAAPTLQQGSE